MLKLNFTKMQALGNDFVILDATESPLELTNAQLKQLANRKYGVGCDQILLIEPPVDNTTNRFVPIKNSSTANNNAFGIINDNPYPKFNYRIFNTDGTEAKQCGNGARCVIEYLYANKAITSHAIALETTTRTLTGRKTSAGIEISMGKPSFQPQDLPYLNEYRQDNQYNAAISSIGEITYGIVSMGNPHAIVQLDPQLITEKIYMLQIAQFLQQTPLFPDSVNVNFFSIIDQTHIQLVTYERAVGFTNACGSGSCATVCYGIQQHSLNNTVAVDNEGGTLYVSVNENNEVFLAGEVATVFSGSILI